MTIVNITDVPIVGSEYTWQETWTWQDVRAGKTWENSHDSNFDLSVSEDVLFSELAQKNLAKPFSESMSITDSDVRRAMLKSVSETFNISESYYDLISFVIRVFESFSVQESKAFNTTMPVAEFLQLTESKFEKKITLSFEEAMSFAEVFGKVVSYRRFIAEGFTVSESLSKSYTLRKNEAFGIFEQYLRGANAVISDMIIDVNDITIDDFKSMMDSGHAPGFSDFNDFVQGDYEYQYAIFRAVMTSVNADRALLTNLKFDIDVPDVFDRGSAEVVNAATGIRVNFSRQFNIIPEIVCMTTGGTEPTIPKLIEKDQEGFTVLLKNSADENRTGTFSWSAHGY